jgi:5'-nucleotidase
MRPTVPFHAARLAAPVATLVFLAGCEVAIGPPGTPPPVPSPEAGPAAVVVQILAFNDFHGSLEAPAGALYDPTQPDAGTLAGGAGHFATTLASLRAEAPASTVVVTAGDVVGASPLASALFHDEPTIAFMNQLGVDYASVGNHEFDQGKDEILRLQHGGCHPADGCTFDRPFTGANFRYLSANVVSDPATGATLFPGYEVKAIAGVKLGFVGMTLRDTPAIVTPSEVAGLEFLDEAGTVNALLPRLRAEGAQAIVVIVHQGGFPRPRTEVSGCGIAGDILPIVEALGPGVDVVISGHTHTAYVCPNIGGKLLTSAASQGKVITRILLTIDPVHGGVTGKYAENRIVYRTVVEDPAAKALTDRAVAATAPLATRVIGRLAGAITRSPSAAGESAAGDVLADAQLAASLAPPAAAEVALVNPGGIRGDLSTEAGDITFGEAFTVQPFGNTLVTLTLTGAQLLLLLEQQWQGQASPRILSPSAGFAYAYRASAPLGSKVEAASIEIGGIPVTPTGVYRVTVNSFLASGGDGFVVLGEGTNRVGGAQDIDALASFLQGTLTGAPLPVPPLDRITRFP